MSNTFTAPCAHCGAAYEGPAWQSVNTAKDPALKARLKDGSLLLWKCPRCGTTNLARYPLLYHDPQEKVMVWLLPEGPVPGSEALDASLETLEGYTLRRVTEVGELVEKINLFDAGLDDVVMEICKYVTRLELAEKEPALADVPLKFLRLEGADNELLFSYPLDGQMFLSRTGFHVYEDCRGILARNPSIRPPKGFAEVDEDWIRRFFR